MIDLLATNLMAHLEAGSAAKQQGPAEEQFWKESRPARFSVQSRQVLLGLVRHSAPLQHAMLGWQGIERPIAVIRFSCSRAAAVCVTLC